MLHVRLQNSNGLRLSPCGAQRVCSHQLAVLHVPAYVRGDGPVPCRASDEYGYVFAVHLQQS